MTKKLTKEEAITVLTVENLELKKEIDFLKLALSECYSRLVCIGGPFNDNVHKFTKEQLKYLKPILDRLEDELGG